MKNTRPALLLILFSCVLTVSGQVFYLLQADTPPAQLLLGSLPTLGAALLFCSTCAMLGRLRRSWAANAMQAALISAALIALVMTLAASIGFWQMGSIPRLQQFDGLTWDIIAPSVKALVSSHGTTLLLALVLILVMLALLWAALHHAQRIRWKLAPIWLAGAALLATGAFANLHEPDKSRWFIASELLRTDLDVNGHLSPAALHAETEFFRNYHQRLAEVEKEPRYPDILGQLHGSNVIWLVMESVRAKDVPLYGGTADMPNMMKARDHMLLFDHLYSQDPRSTKAYAQMDMGKFSLLSWDSYSNNIPWMFPNDGLASHLSDLGYSTMALVNGDGSYDNHKFFQEQHGYQKVMYRQSLNPGSSYADDLKLLEHVRENLAQSKKPFYMMVWPIQTHHPYGREHWSQSQDKLNAETKNPQHLASEDYPRYLESLEQADDWFGRLLDLLQSEKLLDNTVVIVTGDHGEAFREHESGNIFHGNGVYEESVHVLGFMYSPKINGLYTDNRHIRLLDIPATILHMSSEGNYILNDGRSIFNNYKNQIPIYLFNSWRGAAGIIHENQKLWYRTNSPNEIFSVPIDSIRKDSAKERQRSNETKGNPLLDLLNEWKDAMTIRSARLLSQKTAKQPPLNDVIRVYCEDGNGFREENKNFTNFIGLSGKITIQINKDCHALRIAPIERTKIPKGAHLNLKINSIDATGTTKSWNLRNTQPILMNNMNYIEKDRYSLTGNSSFIDYSLGKDNYRVEHISINVKYTWKYAR